MRALLAKPHRVAFLAPDVSLEGPDAPFAREAAALLWVACIELAQRHPAIAVLDPDATPLVPQDGHYAPSGADRGATPTDAIYGPARRDELLWLEVALAPNKPATVKLRSSTGPSFDAFGKSLGDPLQQVFAAWANARELGPFPRRLDPIGVDDLFATLRALAPLLAEQARIGGVRPPDDIDEDADDADDAAETALRMDADAILAEIDAGEDKRKKLVRNAIARVPPALKVVAMRLFELALHDDLADAILALDPEHPQALLRGEPEAARVRRAIAAAPCWAQPYLTLATARSEARPGLRRLPPPGEVDGTDQTPDPDSPAIIRDTPTFVPAASALEIAAGAAFAAVCTPSALSVLDSAARRLSDAGRVDEGVRLLERAVRDHGDDPRTHLALLDVHARTGREGSRLAQAYRSSRLHGCPTEVGYPWYPDQIHIDLRASTALLQVGRLDEAIALRANRLDGREQAWPQQSRVLGAWRKDPSFVAWSYAREGAFRGDEARAVEGFSRVEPADAVDLAIFLDALVALGREDEVLLAWSQFGPKGAVARIAAARALMAAGEWRRGLDELWRVSLTEPGRDEHGAIGRCGLYLSCAPLDVLEAALAEKLAVGAPTLAKRMARDVADFTPGAAKSGVVARALGKSTSIEFDPAWLAGFSADTRSRRAIDMRFGELGAVGADRGDLVRADQLVNTWLEVVFDEASEDDPNALAQAACYVAAHALSRYLALATQAPTVHAGALRTVAGEALALVRRHHEALADRDARALLAAIDAPLRRADRWVGIAWLGTVERSLGLDERCRGDVARFVPDAATVTSRLLGPEEAAVLAWSVSRLHRERPDGWAAACAAQAMRLAMHTGRSGVDEWADAVATQHAARAVDLEDALDQLHTACFLAEGASAGPCGHAARLLFAAGRPPAAINVLCAGLTAATAAWRTANLPSIEAAWRESKSDVPYHFDKVAAGMFEALQKGDPARAEKLGRWAVAFDPSNAEAHRNLGLALAQQGKVADAMRHLVRGTREQATQILSGVLYQAGKLPEAMAVLDYASRWYTRADQWLTYAGIAYAAMDNPRAVRAYRLAYQLDPKAFDTSQLNAFAGVLDEVGDHDTCDKIANALLKAAGDDVMWKTNAWNHLACAAIGLGRFDDAVALAERAIAANPLPDNGPSFAATLERAKTQQKVTPPALQLPKRAHEPVFALLEAGDHAAAAALLEDPSWRVRRAALAGVRFRYASENLVEVTDRARAAANATLAATVGLVDANAVIARALALHVREQAHFPRDPVPQLGDRMTRDAFYAEFRARGGIVLGDDAPPPPPFVDRVVVPTSRIARAADYVALLRALATLDPKEALTEFGLDDDGYLEVCKAWGAAMDADPTIGKTIAAGLAQLA